MRKVAEAINGVTKVPIERVKRVMHNYTVMLCEAMTDLYMEDITITPYNVDDYVVREYLNQEGLVVCDPFSGRVHFDEKHLLLSEKLFGENKVLSAYRKYLMCIEKLNICSSILNVVKKTGRTITFSLRFTVSDNIYVRHKTGCIAEFLTDSGLDSLCTGSAIIHALCDDLGIEYIEGKTYFIDGISASDEAEFAWDIATGNMPLTGEYGELLFKRINSYYEEAIDGMAVLNYENKIFIDSRGYASELINKIRDSKTFVFLDNTHVYFESGFSSENYRSKYVGNGVWLDGVLGIYKDCLSGIQGSFLSVPTENTIPCLVNSNVCYMEGKEFTSLYHGDVTKLTGNVGSFFKACQGNYEVGSHLFPDEDIVKIDEIYSREVLVHAGN